MTIGISIAAPQAGAIELAFNTRSALTRLVDRVQEANAAPATATLTATMKADLKKVGASNFQSHLASMESRHKRVHGPLSAPTPEQRKAYLMAAVFQSIPVYSYNYMSDEAERSTYIVEGAIAAYQRLFFEEGHELDNAHRHLTVLAAACPSNSRHEQDEYVQKRCLGQYVSTGVTRINSANGLGYHENWANSNARGQKLHTELTNGLGDDLEYALAQCLPINIVAIAYTTEEGPMLAGFLSPNDLSRLRFTRKRLGTVLAELGLAPAEVRARVEKGLQATAKASFVVYPNDCKFGDVYIEGATWGEEMRSCMTRDADEYNTWADLHPCDAYSAAYFGSGDNSLALIVAVASDGEMVGRGIYNTRTGVMSRWYGQREAERTLEKLDLPSDCDALRDSWLALLTNTAGTRFIHPYVDGDIAYGDISEHDRRVYLQPYGEGGIELQDTSGSSSLEREVYVQDTGERLPISEAVHQPITDTYISESFADEAADTDDNHLLTDYRMYRCYVTGEWVQSGNTTSIHIGGENRRCAEHVYYQDHRFLTRVTLSAARREYELNDEWAAIVADREQEQEQA